jgi:hypothetical protein
MDILLDGWRWLERNNRAGHTRHAPGKFMLRTGILSNKLGPLIALVHSVGDVLSAVVHRQLQAVINEETD